MNAFALALAIATSAADCPQPEIAIAPPGVCQFPSHEEAMRCRHFACEHTWWLKKQVDAERYWRATNDYLHSPRRLACLEEWQREAEHDYECWDALEDLWREVKHGPIFSGELSPTRRLLKLLGREDYLAGRMPPAAPFDRFYED